MFLKTDERKETIMKRGLRFLATTLLFVMMSGQLCFAAENKETVFEPPKQIFVEGGVLELVGEQPSSVDVPAQLNYQYIVVTAGDNLNVRSGPGTSYSIVGKFKNGQIIEIPFMQPVGGGKDWDYAYGPDANTGKDIEGWVATAYIGNTDWY